MNMVKVSNITKRFNDKLVLDNISFEIEEGEIFGLIGPNGAGKSTLINIMTTLLDQNSGDIIIGDYNLKTQPIKAKELMGLVPQELALIEEMNVYDNLMFFGSLYNLYGKTLKTRINEVLDVTGLATHKKQKVKKLSGGMKRRLNIAAAIMHRPRILILDEPTVGVDPQSRNHIFEFIKRIAAQEKTTIIYTSHYMEEIEELCSKVFIIDLGQEVAYGTKQQIKQLSGKHTKVIFELQQLSGKLVFDLKQVPGVVNTSELDQTVTLITTSEFKLTEAIKVIEVHNSSLQKVSYEEPRLEDVFLNLTGKTLRD